MDINVTKTLQALLNFICDMRSPFLHMAELSNAAPVDSFVKIFLW